MESYRTVTDHENVLLKEKASKFIGFVFHVENETAIKTKLEYLRQLHPKATHHCYAYRLGNEKKQFRANDDGEPAGSAGKPILGQIDSAGVTNCLLIVVRYYGGTPLGIPGLISAYKETARATLAATTIIEHQLMDHYRIKCNYEKVNRVYQLLQRFRGDVLSQELNNESVISIRVAPGHSAELAHQLREEQFHVEFIERK